MKLSGLSKEYRDVARQAMADGWRIEKSGKHVRWTAPNGKVTFTSLTCSDARGIKNHLATMRRMMREDAAPQA